MFNLPNDSFSELSYDEELFVDGGFSFSQNEKGTLIGGTIGIAICAVLVLAVSI